MAYSPPWTSCVLIKNLKWSFKPKMAVLHCTGVSHPVDILLTPAHCTRSWIIHQLYSHDEAVFSNYRLHPNPPDSLLMTLDVILCLEMIMSIMNDYEIYTFWHIYTLLKKNNATRLWSIVFLLSWIFIHQVRYP